MASGSHMVVYIASCVDLAVGVCYSTSDSDRTSVAHSIRTERVTDRAAGESDGRMDLKNFNLIDWLIGQGGVGPATTGDPDRFHFYVPWLIVNLIAILIPLYYALEGRRRLVGHHTLNKWIADRFMNLLWPIGLVGLILEGARYANMAIIGWRFWRYAWALWLLVFIGYWAWYFVFRYRPQLAAFNAQRVKEQYMPKPKRAKSANAR
jgi:hypothetical protein